MDLSINMQKARALTRRHFFGQAGMGFGAIALQQLLARNGYAAEEKGFRIPAKAKSIIYLHMAGSPSQIDLFEHKPALTKFHGKACPKEYLEGKRFAFIKGTPKMLGPVFDYKQHGQSGQWVSELLPGLTSIIDDVCMIRSMHTDQFNHSPAQLLLHTGNPLLGYPSMGSWVTYGLGSENSNLPAFVAMTSNGTAKQGQPLYDRLWGAGFLPGRFQGVKFRGQGDPILDLYNPAGVTREQRRRMLDALNKLNQDQASRFNDPAIATRIAQYELAFRMQMSVPELIDIKSEPKSVLDMYGPDATKSGRYAYNCLLARRLAERGVRFIQLYHRGWDAHGNAPKGVAAQCRDTDQSTAALLRDLKQRGMLDDTLVVWGGEFGRTIYCQGKLTKQNYGRDHHPNCFTYWLAGGGVKGGITYGETDDYSVNVTENPVHVHDLQATILHQLGINHERLTYRYQGRYFRLTDVHGKVVKDVLS